MKNIFIISVGAMLLFSSCEKFLSKSPDNRTRLDSPQAVSELLVSAYPDAMFAIFTEVMSDNAGDKGLGQYVIEDVTNDNPYFWKDDFSGSESPVDYWNACYKAIAHSNQALQAIEEADDKEAYSTQKGEALVTRAYSHFMLVNIFAKHYNPTTCDTDLGVPYVTEPEDVVYRQYKRATVGEIYKKIEADLIEASTLIKDEAYAIPKYHFTQDAFHAFASRFYLYMGKWDKVIEHSNKVLGTNPVQKLRDWNGKYSNFSDINEMWATYAKADEPCNILLVRAITDWPSGLVALRYSLSASKKDELFPTGFEATRFATVLGDKVVMAGSSDQCQFIPKYPRRYQDMGSNMVLPNTICPLFCMEEVLFNRAEAFAMLKQYDAVLADLDYYYQKRVADYKPEDKVDEALVRAAYKDENGPALAAYYPVEKDLQELYVWYILDLRRREFIHEGLRWFDIKRYNFPVEHNLYGKTEKLILKKDDLRRAIQIPESAIAAGVEANPR